MKFREIGLQVGVGNWTIVALLDCCLVRLWYCKLYCWCYSALGSFERLLGVITCGKLYTQGVQSVGRVCIRCVQSGNSMHKLIHCTRSLQLEGYATYGHLVMVIIWSRESEWPRGNGGMLIYMYNYVCVSVTRYIASLPSPIYSSHICDLHIWIFNTTMNMYASDVKMLSNYTFITKDENCIRNVIKFCNASFLNFIKALMTFLSDLLKNKLCMVLRCRFIHRPLQAYRLYLHWIQMLSALK